jgi:hypothetical protein
VLFRSDETLEAYKQGGKFVTMLAKEEVERICRENEKGTIQPDSLLCLDKCTAKSDPSGSFWSATLECDAKCRVECEVNKY